MKGTYKQSIRNTAPELDSGNAGLPRGTIIKTLKHLRAKAREIGAVDPLQRAKPLSPMTAWKRKQYLKGLL